MADPMTIMMVGGTILQAAGQISQGNAADANAKAQQEQLEYQAKVREINAGQERAAAQRRAIEERRQGDLASSRARAVAAAGGGDTFDPSVIDILGDLDAEGQYYSDIAMYEGEERARDLESGAALNRHEGQMARSAGKQAKKQSRFAAASTIMKGGADTMASKYGDTFADGSPRTTDIGGGDTIHWKTGRYGGYR